jgi:hypothetical protein
MPQESSGSDQYRGKSLVRLFTGLWDSGPCIVGLRETWRWNAATLDGLEVNWHRFLVDEHMEKKLANIQGAMYSLVAPRELLTVTSGNGASCIFIRMALWLRVVRALLFIKWVWVDFGIRSQVRLVFSLLSWVLCSLHCNTLLRRGVLFSLIVWVRSGLYAVYKNSASDSPTGVWM